MKKLLLITSLIATTAFSGAAFAGGNHTPAQASINNEEDNNPNNNYYTSNNPNMQEVSNFYIGLSGGWTYLEDQSYSFGATPVNTDLDTGWNAALHLGYDFALAQGLGLRPELEVSYRSSDVDTHEVAGVQSPGSSGDINTWAGMANFYYDVKNSSMITPYIGGGIGAARVSLDNYTSGITGNIIDDEDTVFAYQGMAGVDFALNEDWSIFTEYKYFATTDVEVATTAGNSSDIDLESHNIGIGLKFKL